MATQSQMQSVIYAQLYGNHKTEKVNAVAIAASKFINKYKKTNYVSGDFVIDACLQMYSIEKDLSAYLEREKSLFVK